MLLQDGLIRAQAAIAAYAPGAAQPQVLNDPAPDQDSFVFRAALAGGGSLIAKVAPPGRLAAQFARLQASHPQMSDGLYRVPQPYSYAESTGVLLMEDGWGMSAETLWQNGGDGPARALGAAGGWLARYHRLSVARTAFNPDPHLNWLRKSLAAHTDHQRRFPDVASLVAEVPRLERLAESARAAPTLRAITHGDFHLRNLLVRKQGRAYGIDMENAGRDEVMRDLLFFLCDCAVRAGEAPTCASLHATASPLRRAYGRPPADPAARLFFQRSFALNLWAGLDAGTSDLPAKASRRLQTAQLLLEAGDLFADPPDSRP